MAELVREALEGYLGNGRVPVAAESRSTGRPPEPPSAPEPVSKGERRAAAEKAQDGGCPHAKVEPTSTGMVRCLGCGKVGTRQSMGRP